MKNICTICGGGISEYTAPEARCVCKANDSKRKDYKHEMLLAESRYLTACGWKAVDAPGGQVGFTWNAPNGEGPFTQPVAVSTQMDWDSDPKKQQFIDLGTKVGQLDARIREKQMAKVDHKKETDMRELFIKEMSILTKDAAKPASPPAG